MPGETTETLKRNIKPKDSDVIEFAGDFNLAAVVIQSHMGEGVLPESGGENILPQMIELNIYESINKKAITGSIPWRLECTCPTGDDGHGWNA